jgi:mRNA interferase MazF
VSPTASAGALPSRGEIWLIDLDFQTRAALVVSTDAFNHGPAELVMAVPITTAVRGIPSDVPVDDDSFAVCERLLCLSRARLRRRVGRAPAAALAGCSKYLRVLLEL